MESKTKLIIPAAGKSSRFPDMRPKWLLTHPNGKLMIENVISNLITLDLDIYLATTAEISKKYDVPLIMQQLFGNKVQVVEIPYQTKGPAETVDYILTNIIKEESSIIIKDSDSYVGITALENLYGNFSAGVDLKIHEVNQISSKSYIKKDNNNLIVDIVEKKISSDFIAVGLYGFSSSSDFHKHYVKLTGLDLRQEIFISHIIYSMLVDQVVFRYIEASQFKDWGTINEWKSEIKKHQTVFCDYDGVLVYNKGKFGKENWHNSEDVPIIENVKFLKQLVEDGATVLITTSRSIEFKTKIEHFLRLYEIPVFDIVCGLPHSTRILINDFAPSNPYPSAISVNVERNNQIAKYF